MLKTGRRRIGLAAVVITGAALFLPILSYAQSLPATAAATGAATAAASSSAPAKRLAVDEVLSKKLAAFNFQRAPIADVIKHMAESYDLDINNEYELTDNITYIHDDVSARQAINFLNTALLSLGYTVVETVPEGSRVRLTIVPTKKDAGTLVPLYNGFDPALIPEGNERRTQVMVLKNADVEKARDMIVAIVGKQAEVTVNVPTKTLIITDTATHVHTSAALVTQLEKEASGGK
jgi:type II secretory pathway component GspD/PulD (secretin)